MGGFHGDRGDLVDPDDKVDKPSKNQKRKRTDADTDGCHEDPDVKRIMLLLMKPSYTINHKTKSLRSLHRHRLRVLLSRLIREQNWKEACGVISVYLLTTVKSRCPENNRFKYTALFTLLQRMSPDAICSSRRMHKTHDIWMRRIGCSKNTSAGFTNTRVRMSRKDVTEFMLFCLEEGDLELLCYKAACAAHMYGEKIEYVKEVLKNSIGLHTRFQ